jgi:ATPase subunit of ABC transporter with duplicated ATPase domains
LYNDVDVLTVVIMGNEKLFKIMKEREAIYLKENFTDEDGIKAGKLEAAFAEMDGWNAESDAAIMLNGLGIGTELHEKILGDLKEEEKIKVLLAQALFGNPDVLLLDEPTNGLDIKAVEWLEEFLINFENTVIVVSHDRYFLNKVCTNIADIDYGKIKLFVGNYDFWYESSKLIQRQMKESNKKKEDRIKELQDFIARFSANASKSKQATSRKKMLEKIKLDDIKPSNRRYPFIEFKPDREIGNDVLEVKNLTKTIDGIKVLDNVSFIMTKTDKIAFVGENSNGISTLFSILSGEMKADSGEFKWGQTITTSYFPKESIELFKSDITLTDWLRVYSKEKDDAYVRGYLGRMLFTGEESMKKASVISGGERVRCMLAKMQLSGANALLLDEPTNHLDMESITSLNDALKDFNGVVLLRSYDHQLVETVANRIICLDNGKIIDKKMTYDEYLKLGK